MKNLKKSFFIFTICMSLVAPQLMTEASEIADPFEIDEITGSDEPNTSEFNHPEETISTNKTEAISENEADEYSISEEEAKINLEGKVPVSMLEGGGPAGEPESGAHGSGSYQLNSVPDDSRFYTEYYVSAASGKNYKTANIERRTSVRVFAKAGEKILFGSSVSNSEIDEKNVWTKRVTGKDIVITTPGGEKVCEDVVAPTGSTSGVGYIANPTQEKNGPMVNQMDRTEGTGKYYAPLTYEVHESGVYTFEFHSVRGHNDGTSPTPRLAKDQNWQQGTTSVAAWDVTVLGEDSNGKWAVKEGRAWADYLALTTGGADAKSDLNVHVLTHDGYVYKVDFDESVPFGFIFFANNTGFMTAIHDESGHTEYRPIYHSFYDATNDLDNMSQKENIVLHKPNEQDTQTEETYKIFFNKPSQDLSEIDMKTEPEDTVLLSNLKFNGIGENLSRSGHGGYFSFQSSGEATVTIRLDLRKAIFESENTMDSYEGSGIVEITAPAHAGSNSFYWDGKDTEGIVLPAGIYGDNNVVLTTEIKRGELHFPVIDMEGLYGGLHIARLNGTGDAEGRYDLYYNNFPLAYGTIEGKSQHRITQSGYDILSDGTKSFKVSSDKGGSAFFPNNQNYIATLHADTKDYLAKKFFDSSYEMLSQDRKDIIDAEYGKEYDTFHFEPVDSRNTTMKFSSSGYYGGGNQAGIDAWTYYMQGVEPHVISFAIMDSLDRGLVRGQIFYDANINSEYDPAGGDYLLPNVRVRLIKSNGEPLIHEEWLPVFDSTGHFVFNEDGTVKHKLQNVDYETVTDSAGLYRFTGVPFVSASGETTKYFVQVLLSDVQTEVLRYTCTTSEVVKEKLKKTSGDPFLTETIEAAVYGPDGNKIVQTDDATKIYHHKYDRNDENHETVFDPGNAQAVTFSSDDIYTENGIRVEEFNKIGYSSTVPSENRKNYKLTKIWGQNSQGIDTHPISDGLIVELWVWNDSDVEENNKLELSRRTGALLDTQILNEKNGWTHTWNDLDDRLQYYILEYYTKKKDNGEIIYNDNHEPRRILIGGTMPIFGEVPSGTTNYGFKADLGDYPEAYYDSDSDKMVIPIQSFAAGGVHPNAITQKEKLESVDNNARQYIVEYALSQSGDTYKIDLTNSQVFDDRTYYVWLDHQTVLPELISQSYVEDGNKKSHALVLEKDQLVADGEYTIKGLSVSSVDAAKTENTEGNATNAFRISENGKDALFTATDHGNYKTGTGTRTYQVKYVVDSSKTPVSIKVNTDGELVRSDDTNIKVESDSNYRVYTWYMTIHVYNVEPDGVIEYNPNSKAVKLQAALAHGAELKWTLSHDGSNYNSISYTSNDKRTKGILHNDIYRVPLYKAADDPNMGSCADLVGIAYAGSTPVDDVSELEFEDTYESRYSLNALDHVPEDGRAITQGSRGYVKAVLTTPRDTRINRTQDHANYAEITFVPNHKGKKTGTGEDVFYYKIVVFAEDSTYQNYQYGDIDASEGVVMYTYFTLKPMQQKTKKKHKHDPEDETKPVLGGGPTQMQGVKMTSAEGKQVVINPDTGDDNHLLRWIILMVLSGLLLVMSSYFYKKRNR